MSTIRRTRRGRNLLATLTSISLGLAGLSVAAYPAVAEEESNLSPLDAVNMWIGTYHDKSQNKANDAYGNTWPGATLPFGMVQFTPTTYNSTNGEKRGGYEYTADYLRGFGMTRLSGTGCMGSNSGFSLPLLAYSGEMDGNNLPVSPASNIKKYYMGFTHENETANPGYYQVALEDEVVASLTATNRTTVANFDFPDNSSSSTILFNATGGNNTNGAAVLDIDVDNQTVSGYTTAKTVCGGGDYRIYYSAKFDQPFTNYGTWNSAASTPGSITSTDTGEDKVGAFFQFDSGAEIGIQTGISYVSIDNAKLNRETEASDKSFDALRAEAEQTWVDALGTIDVTGGSEAERIQFYTGLYHALIHPNIYEDVNGEYRAYGTKTTMSETVHTLKEGQEHEYVTYASWDSFRGQMQLVALLFPERASDMAQSIYNMADQTGTWYNWPHLGSAQNKMQGDGLQIIVSAMDAFGAQDYDRHGALESMVSTQSLGEGFNSTRLGALSFAGVGWIEDRSSVATSTTLDLAVADFAISQLADRLDDSESAALFLTRSQNWRNLISQDTNNADRIVPRDRKGFWSAFDLSVRDYSSNKPDSGAQNHQFDQSTGLQYQWMVPHDLGGLIDELGGTEAATAKLDSLLTQLDTSGSNSQYAYMSNQPNMHLPWVYNWLGQPQKATETVDRSIEELFFDDAIVDGKPGIPGNDDLGSYGAWYVWASIGLFPEVFGTADLALSAPCFEKVVINSEDSDRTITINAPGAKEHRVIKSLSVNGQDHSAAWLAEDFSLVGGTLEYEMGEGESSWGTNPEDLPPSYAGNINGYNSTGTSIDGSANAAALEFSANSLSRNELERVNSDAVPGGTIHWNDIEFPWPDSEPTKPDHWIPWGQEIDMNGQYASELSFLGLATNGPSTGTATVNYSDGSTQKVEVYFTDWTPSSDPAGGNTAVIKMDYRNKADGTPNNVSNKVQLFATAPAQLDSTKAIKSVTLPNDVTKGIMHIFSVGLNPAPSPVVLPGVPTDVTATQAEGTNNKIDIMWKAPTDSGSGNIAEYRIYQEGITEPIITVSANETLESRIENLDAGTYRFAVSAVSDAGEGEKSDWVTATVTDPEPPTNTPKVKRFGGANRYETSLLIAKETATKGNPVFLVNGTTFADGVSAGPAAIKESATLLVVPKDKLPETTLKFLKDIEPSNIYLIGEKQALSQEIHNQLSAVFPSVERIGGQDRYATSQSIVQKFFVDAGGKLTSEQLFLATGTNFADSTAAAPVAGTLSAPILLVNGKANGSIPTVIKQAGKPSLQIVIVGGPEAINNSYRNAYAGLYDSVTTVQGKTRYETTVEINKYRNTTQEDTGEVVENLWFASGLDFADTLSASVVTGKAGNRLYLSQNRCLPNTVLTAFQSYTKLQQINIVGGKVALSPAVELLKSCS